MARPKRCKSCGRLRLFARAGPALCRSCEGSLRPEIYQRLLALDDARHTYRVARDPEARERALGEIIAQAEALLPFEEKGIPTSLPTPSELLAEFKSTGGGA